ncbi:MAG: hypothetical protein A2008_07670 [Candidatus Wallbacteria bacterium GWC2_49_35]|uniref:Fibronectin type-III domain-containing protein n=1 Tax=Candidatus Wallbacteria bacterium GWC2_49_35 TaxID=1817813 RepID=A0A1F7WE06_9BACT|nr:MAG: hypothetical protein A2008_07670 [Candidatus Wallbacteria bacterium GWC2_49_35]HBC74552.1 hypothetical protein [Candidatus Wallbacteria bacterium]
MIKYIRSADVGRRFFAAMLFALIIPAAGLLFFLPQPCAANGFTNSPEPAFDGLAKKWETASAEIELKFKNLTETDLAAIENQIYYLYITKEELGFLVRLLLKSGNEKAVDIAGRVLSDPKFGYIVKMDALSAFSNYIAGAERPGAARAVNILENFVGSPVCKNSKRLFIASLKAMTAKKDKNAETAFMRHFDAEKNTAVKLQLLDKIAEFSDGLDILKKEYEKASAENDMIYRMAVLKVLADIKGDDAFLYLSELMRKAETAGRKGPLYNHITDIAASCADMRFLPVIEKMISSENAAEITKGFEYLSRYSKISATTALSLYGKLSGGSRKNFFFRNLIGLAGSKHLAHLNAPAEEIKATYSILKDALNGSDPALVKQAFGIIWRDLSNIDFKKLAAADIGEDKFLMPLAFYLNGERSHLIDRIKAGVSLETAVAYRDFGGGWYYNFAFDPSEFKTDAELAALFRFIKLQHGTSYDHIIAEIVKTGDAAAIRKLAEFSHECSLDFIEEIKRHIILNIEKPGISTDEFLVEFSGYKTSREYLLELELKKRRDAAGGSLKKYMLALKDASREEISYASAAIGDMIKKSPGELDATLMDDCYPLESKLLLIGAASQRAAELKDIIGKARLQEIIVSAASDARLAAGACSLLARIDASAALDSIKTAMADPACHQSRKETLLGACGEIKTPECAQFLVDTFISPALVPIVNEKEGGGASGNVNGDAAKGGPDFKTARDILFRMDDLSKSAVFGLIKQKPYAAHIFLEYLHGFKDDAAVKYYLDNFDAEKMPAQGLDFLRRNVNESNIDRLKEFYSKRSSDRYARLFAAALFCKNNIPGPAAAEIENKDAIDTAFLNKLFEAGCDYNFITDFYGAKEKYIDALSGRTGKSAYKTERVINRYNDRFEDPFNVEKPLQTVIFFADGRILDEKARQTVISDKTRRSEYLKYLSSGGKTLYDFEENLMIGTLADAGINDAELRELTRISLKENFLKLRAAVKSRLKETFKNAVAKAGASVSKKTDAADLDDTLNALIDCSDIADFEDCAALAGDAVRARAITPVSYAGAVWRLFTPFDAEAAGWRALTIADKSKLVNAMLSSGCFDPAKLFGEKAYLYAPDFNLLSSAEAADVKFLDELIATKKKEGFGYIHDIYTLRLVKTKSAEDKLKFIIDSIADAGENEIYNVLDSFKIYFSTYSGEELKKYFAMHYSDKLDKIKNNEGLLKMTAKSLKGETLRGVINAYAASKENAYDLPRCVFDAYAAGDDPDKYKYLEAFCRSGNYRVKNNSLRALRGSGEKGFAILKSLFESAAAGERDRKYPANEYIGAMAETGSGSALEYLRSIAVDEKFSEYHERAIGEIGEIKTAESLNWLISQLFSHKQSRRVFDALISMGYEMTVELLEAEKKASGKTRAAIDSILFQNSIQKPFLELMAKELNLVYEIGGDFRPPASRLESSSKDVAMPPALLKQAIAAVSGELKKAAAKDPKPDKDKIEFYSYLCLFLSCSEDPEDIKLLIELLGDENYAPNSARTLIASAQDASDELMKAARAEGNPAGLQKRLIGILTAKNVSGARDIYLKALSSADRDLFSAALEAVSKFKIKEAVPVMVSALASADGEDYYLAGSLASFGFESFDPLIDAMAAGGNTIGLYSALGRIIGGAARGAETGDANKMTAALQDKYARYSKENPKISLLIAFLLAGLDEEAALKESMAADGDILTLAGEDIFNYMGRDKFIKLGAEATTPLMNLFAKSVESRSRLRYDILDIIEKTGDTKAAPLLAAFLKTPGEQYIKRRALEVLSKISKDSVMTYLNILSGEKDYQLKLGAAKCLAEMTGTDEFCRAEILKLLHGGLEDEIKAVLAGALAKARYAPASAVMLEAVKNSQSAVLLDAASNALYRLDILDSIRANLKNILKESPKEINQAYAARVLAYYSDSGSVEALNAALENAVGNAGEKAGEFKKIELIKAAAAIKSNKFIGSLSLATADNSERVRSAAALALKIIAGDNFSRYCAPGPPASLKASPLDGAVELSWEAPPDKTVKYYEIYRDGKPIDAKPSGCSYTDKDLKNGKNYVYYLKAVDADSNTGAPCATSTAVPSAPPGPVSGLKLKSGLSYITLEWKYQAPGDNAVEVDHFVVERGSRPIAKIPPASPGYTDYGLSAGKIYAYKVYAVNRMGGSGEKAGASAAPHFNMKGGE